MPDRVLSRESRALAIAPSYPADLSPIPPVNTRIESPQSGRQRSNLYLADSRTLTSFGRLLALLVSVPVSAHVGVSFGEVWDTAAKFRELWPPSRLTEHAWMWQPLLVCPNLVAGMTASKCYSSCYSSLRVLGAFRVGWCRLMSRAVSRDIAANI